MPVLNKFLSQCFWIDSKPGHSLECSQAFTECRDQSEVKSFVYSQVFSEHSSCSGDTHNSVYFPAYMPALTCFNLLKKLSGSYSQALAGLLYVVTVILCPRQLRCFSFACSVFDQYQFFRARVSS